METNRDLTRRVQDIEEIERRLEDLLVTNKQLADDNVGLQETNDYYKVNVLPDF